MLKLSDIWHGLIGTDDGPLGSLAEQPIADVAIDSRSAGPGSLFVALLGERTDGHLYIADAFGRGAVAAIPRRGLLTWACRARG